MIATVNNLKSISTSDVIPKLIEKNILKANLPNTKDHTNNDINNLDLNSKNNDNKNTIAAERAAESEDDDDIEDNEYKYIKKLLENELIKKETYEDLTLYSYINCTNNDTRELKQCRGLIFKNHKLFLKSYAYTDIYDTSEKEKIIANLKDYNFNDLKFYNSLEGTLIRLFYNNNKWYVSTHRKLNAYESRWGCKKSFGEIFEEAIFSELLANEKFVKRFSDDIKNDDINNILKLFFSILNTDIQYFFYLPSLKINRIVCEGLIKPSIIYVSAMKNLEYIKLNDDIYIPELEEIKFSTLDNMLKYVDELNIKQYQGVLILKPNNEQIKILNQKYKIYFNSRGNQSNIIIRYLEKINDPEIKANLRILYPEFITRFNEIDDGKKFNTIINNIHICYEFKYIRKRQIRIPHEEYQIMKKCHEWYINEKIKGNNVRVTFEKVKEEFYKILNISPYYVYSMLMHLKTNVWDEIKQQIYNQSN